MAGAHFGFIPFFKTPAGPLYAGSTFIAGVVVGLDDRCPLHLDDARGVLAGAGGREGGRAGAGRHRWGIIKKVVLPFGRGGMVGGAMLGLGRALGETIAVAIISPSFTISPHILQTGGNTIGANIAHPVRRLEPADVRLQALMAAGPRPVRHHAGRQPVASLIVRRSRSGGRGDLMGTDVTRARRPVGRRRRRTPRDTPRPGAFGRHDAGVARRLCGLRVLPDLAGSTTALAASAGSASASSGTCCSWPRLVRRPRARRAGAGRRSRDGRRRRPGGARDDRAAGAHLGYYVVRRACRG